MWPLRRVPHLDPSLVRNITSYRGHAVFLGCPDQVTDLHRAIKVMEAALLTATFIFCLKLGDFVTNPSKVSMQEWRGFIPFAS